MCRLGGELRPKREFPILRGRVYLRCFSCIRKIPRDVLYARDKGVCGICVRAVPFSEASVDHVIPISRGGQHSWDNVRLTHIRCNMRKGSRLDSELPGLV